MYEYRDFSKADKKLLQSLIDVAVQRAIENFTKKTQPIHKTIVENEHEDIRVPFWKLYDQFHDFHKKITRTYDTNSVRNTPRILAESIIKGNLRIEDLQDFSANGKRQMKDLINVLRSR